MRWQGGIHQPAGRNQSAAQSTQQAQGHAGNIPVQVLRIISHRRTAIRGETQGEGRDMKRLHDKIDQQAQQIETQAQTITRQNVRISKDAQRIAGLEAAYRRQAEKLHTKIFKGQNNG